MILCEDYSPSSTSPMLCPLTDTTAVFDIILLPSFDQQTIRQHYLSTVRWLEKSFVSVFLQAVEILRPVCLTDDEIHFLSLSFS